MSAIELDPHQVDALRKMKNGCILCGGTGSGKTRTALAYYFYRICGGGYDEYNDLYLPMTDPIDLYVITTAATRDKHSWDEEMVPFLLSTNPDVCLYGHDIKIVIDSWNNIKKYKDVKNAFFIFDEQRVVGSGVWVKTFLKIAKNNQWIMLSATPGDKWEDYEAVFVANGFYKDQTELEDEHFVYQPFLSFPKIERYLGVRKLMRLRESILIPMDVERNTVQNHIDISVSYDKLLYRQVMKTRWNIYKDEPIENPSELCYTLRKIINSDESRQTALLELLEKRPKAIIFYNYDYELDILRNLGYGEDVEIAEWNGHCHQPVPESKKWVYLVNYAAGAEGWNCITTDTVIFYSSNYSYKVMVQASGRIDRLNTRFRDLYYYHLKSSAPIDLAIERALKEKKKFNESGFVKKFR